MGSALEVTLSLIDNLTGDMDSAITSVDDLGTAVNGADAALSGLDDTVLNDIANSADNADSSLQAIQEAAAMANAGIADIDPTPLDEVNNSASNASGAIEGVAGAGDAMSAAMGAVAGAGIVAFLGEAASASGNMSDNWERMTLTFGKSGDTIAQTQAAWSSSVTKMGADTGRGLGNILTTMNDLGRAGITNQALLTTSFTAISGTAFASKNSFEAVETAYTRVIRTGMLGARQLQAFGLSSDQVFKATGLSVAEVSTKLKGMDATSRAAYMNTILNASGAQAAIEAYQHSWEHLVDSGTRAVMGLARAVGDAIKPVLIPVMEAAIGAINGLIGVFRALPGPIQTVIGIVTLIVSGIVVLITSWGLLGGAISSIGAAFMSAGAMLGLFGAEATAAEVGSMALEAALGPVGWVLLAITLIAIAAIAIWQRYSAQIMTFYNNLTSANWGAAAGNISGAFTELGNVIGPSLTNIGQQVWTFFANLPALIGNISGQMITLGAQIINWIITGLMSLVGTLTATLTNMLTAMADPGTAGAAGQKTGAGAGKGLIDGFIAWITVNGPLMIQSFIQIMMVLLPLLLQVFVLILQIVGVYIYTWATTAGLSIVTGILMWVASLPGRLVAIIVNAGVQFLIALGAWLAQLPFTIAYWLGFAIGYVISWALRLPGLARQAGIGLLNGFISFVRSLPGQLWGLLMSAINYVSSFASQAPSRARSGGQGIVNGVISAIRGLPRAVWDVMMSMVNSVANAGGQAYTAAVRIGQQIWNGFMAGIGKHSPSYLEKAMDEIVERAKLMPEELKASNLGLGKIGWDKDLLDNGGTISRVTTSEVNVNVDLSNVPAGNSDKRIADMIIEGLDNRQVVDKLNSTLGTSKNRLKRNYGA